ncbi:TIGR03619 family F420-dependent LLM class oxidoreductase [Nonomuraea rhizosphaerae]|uniref:TIGR03619 family F420-dependent LLM class oxidoreductase n=1 Tax=Nonomuraea rhizosphaerae TaxID=2665663 RepID=UPI001C5E69F9|nr:TIGR03619 family F420-dependent LLM class oxidoreductase [Nonomuraea rhizosphaerae]
MDVGLYGLHRGENVDPDVLARRARTAEEAGFESLWVGDHIALPDSPDEPGRLEAVVALAHLAALTSTVRLGFGVLVLPQRQPVLLAKQLTSLDLLSRGRLIVGVGAGYVEPELAAMGVPLDERGARTDEYLAAMRAVWDDHPFSGNFVTYADVVQRPRPSRRPPIVVGGHSRAAMRRAVRSADGWYGVYLTPDEAAGALSGLRDAVKAYGRPEGMGELEITITPPPGPVDRESVRRYADLGVHRLTIQPLDADMDADLEAMARAGAGLWGTP